MKKIAALLIALGLTSVAFAAEANTTAPAEKNVTKKAKAKSDKNATKKAKKAKKETNATKADANTSK